MSRTPNTKCCRCETPCYVRPSQMARQDAWFCSNECWEKSKPRKRRASCLYCDGDFLKKPSSNAKYCSRACSNHARTGIKYDGSRRYDNVLSHARRKRLLIESRGEQCEWCGLGPVWNGRPLTLQIDHIDGDINNNDLANLRLLCPNCHTQTDTWAGRANRTVVEAVSE